MRLRFDPTQLRHELERLPPSHRTVFAADCCERLLPNYAAFARATRWGHPSILREGLNYVWTTLEKATIDRSEVERMIKRCEAVIPHTEDFASEYTSAAVDAGTATVETLMSLVDDSSQHVLDVATFCRDTVDMFIQERDHLDFNTDGDFEERIARDPLMIQELKRQAEILRQLLKRPVLSRFMLRRLRADTQNRGTSNIGLSI
jgi:uncharacterized protein YjaG (DUF416 family)